MQLEYFHMIDRIVDLNVDAPGGWVLREADAINAAGQIVGYGTHSNQTRGFLLTACRGDFNADGVVSSQDFFDFLNAFFAGNRSADGNHDEMLDSQDFFDFIVAFFAGC